MRGYSAIGLINTKTEANVGGALRGAYCFGASIVVIQGARYKRIATDTMATYRSIPLIETDDIYSLVPFDCIPVCVEINEKSRCITNFIHPERAFYIFGPEDGSVPKNIMDRCKHIISIPTKHCLNLASTVNVVLYDRLLKSTN